MNQDRRHSYEFRIPGLVNNLALAASYSQSWDNHKHIRLSLLFNKQKAKQSIEGYTILLDRAKDDLVLWFSTISHLRKFSF